jgi:hypothetical protein
MPYGIEILTETLLMQVGRICARHAVMALSRRVL